MRPIQSVAALIDESGSLSLTARRDTLLRAHSRGASTPKAKLMFYSRHPGKIANSKLFSGEWFSNKQNLHESSNISTRITNLLTQGQSHVNQIVGATPCRWKICINLFFALYEFTPSLLVWTHSSTLTLSVLRRKSQNIYLYITNNQTIKEIGCWEIGGWTTLADAIENFWKGLVWKDPSKELWQLFRGKLKICASPPMNTKNCHHLGKLTWRWCLQPIRGLRMLAFQGLPTSHNGDEIPCKHSVNKAVSGPQSGLMENK